MSLVQQTPIHSLDPRDRLRHAAFQGGKAGHAAIDGKQISVPEGTSVMRAAMETRDRNPEALRHRHAGRVRLLPAVPDRDRRPRRNAGVLHHAGRRRHGGAHPERPARPAPQGRHGALRLRPSGGFARPRPNMPTSICWRPPRPSACEEVRYGFDGARHPQSGHRRIPIPISPSIPPSASSAHAACAPARRCKAPSR